MVIISASVHINKTACS